MDYKFCNLLLPWTLFLLATTHSPTTSSSCLKVERNALLILKHNLQSVNNSLLPSWVGDNCCRWKGISCNNITWHVTELLLSSKLSKVKSLDGNILLPLLSLHYLTILDLSDNNFTGSQIPKFLGSFKSLIFLDLSYTGFAGLVPEELGNLSNLEHLRINEYGVKNHKAKLLIKNPRWLSQLKSLKILYLDSIKIGNSSGSTITSAFCEMKYLIFLELSNNKFWQELPDCWNSTYLEYIAIPYNHLQGKIPESLCNLPKLLTLHLSHNSLSGPLPACFINSKSLVALDLSHNKITGNIPSPFGNSPLSFSLSALNLRSNYLTGRIPDLSSLQYLQVLELSNNSLSGPIPPSLGNMTAMRSIDNNKSISNIKKIHIKETFWLVTKGKEQEYVTNVLVFTKLLDLSQNHLIGHIPDKLVGLHGIQTLNLSRNHLTGQIPRNINGLQLLENLDLSINELSGSIPPSMSTLNFLVHLNLSNNNLSGRIPTGYQLQTLDDPTIYEDNPYLCGSPLTNLCKDDSGESDKDEMHSDCKDETSWLFMGMIPGFVIGFWVVCGALILNAKWRIAYFQTIDQAYQMLFN